jgi:integrase
MMATVRLTTRPSRDGSQFTYVLEYSGAHKKRRRISLGHSDRDKAERQRRQKERELQTGLAAGARATIGPVNLKEFWADSQDRTRGQIRPSSMMEQDIAMRHLIETIGNIDLAGVRMEHGERFVQACLDKGNSPATAFKKIKSLKRVFQLAVHRGQIDANPFHYLRSPKIAEQEIRIYTHAECRQIIKAAASVQQDDGLDWDLLISMALCTGMRRGELLNLVWPDIDFEKQTARVAPKVDAETWPWLIKDAERRTLPLTDEVAALLLEHQDRQPHGYPYVLVPPKRQDHIQQRRRQGLWTLYDGRCPVNNFNTRFARILRVAGIKSGMFHDLRRTCITRWFQNGLSEFDVMKLAGHSDFATTHKFYLAVCPDLIDKARAASKAAMAQDFVTRPSRARHTAPATQEEDS